MTTALATADQTELRSITLEQKELVRSMVFKGATDDELSLYFFECQRRGVHPLDRLIHPQKRKDGDEGSKVVFVTSIDYFRSESETSGDYAGIDEPIFEGTIKQGELDVPELAKVTVYRFMNGERIGFTGVARWKEFYPGEKQGMMWRKMSYHMLAKCAEVQARRLAWPKRLGGLYIPEEMLHDDAQAEKPASKAATVQPPKQAAQAPAQPPKQKESGQPKIKEPDAPCTDAQAKAIHSMLSKLNIEAEYHHSYAAQQIGLEYIPESMYDLTKGQASEIIDTLNKELNG